jgi:hypothetical protein
LREEREILKKGAVLSLAKEPHGSEPLSALNSCLPHHEVSANVNMHRCSTGPLRVIKDADMALTTFGMGSYSG